MLYSIGDAEGRKCSERTRLWEANLHMAAEGHSEGPKSHRAMWQPRVALHQDQGHGGYQIPMYHVDECEVVIGNCSYLS